MNADDVTQLDKSVPVGDDSVPNALDAMPGGGTARGGRARFRLSRLQISAAAAAVLVVVIASLVYVNVNSPAATASRPARHVVLPPTRPDTISGAVLDNGRPLSGVDVSLALEPNSSIMSTALVGQSVSMQSLPVAQTNANGGFTVALGNPGSISRTFRENNVIVIDVDVLVGDRVAEWDETCHLDHNTAAPIRMVFDFGAHIIRVNGHTSYLTIVKN